MRVEDGIPWLGILVEKPFVEGNGFLSWMDPWILLGSLGSSIKDFCIGVETGPGVFGHRHAEGLADGQLSPNHKAAGRGKIKVIASPDDLILGDPEKFFKVFGTWGIVPVGNVRSRFAFNLIFINPLPAVSLYLDDGVVGDILFGNVILVE